HLPHLTLHDALPISIRRAEECSSNVWPGMSVPAAIHICCSAISMHRRRPRKWPGLKKKMRPSSVVPTSSSRIHCSANGSTTSSRSEEHTSELQSPYE